MESQTKKMLRRFDPTPVTHPLDAQKNLAILSMAFSPKNQKKHSLKKINRNYEPIPMFWDAEKKKLVTNFDPLRDQLRFDDSDSQSDFSDTEENIQKLARKLKDRVVLNRNKDRNKNFHAYVQKKCSIFQERMKQGEVL